MTFAQRGMYLEMLLEQWENLTLPDSPAECADLIGGTVHEWSRHWPVLRARFVSDEPGRIYNVRLERERHKQQSRSKRASDRGMAGARARWATGSNAHTPETAPLPEETRAETGVKPDEPDSTSIDQASAANGIGIRENGFPSPLPISIAIASPTPDPPRMAIVDDEIAKRGAWLVERYGELYRQHRHGARYRQRPNLDWVEGCDLCRIWDNARLEKLAVLVLTTDDGWISRTDRSFKIFAMKASWADDRLRQWEVENDVAAT